MKTCAKAAYGDIRMTNAGIADAGAADRAAYRQAQSVAGKAT